MPGRRRPAPDVRVDGLAAVVGPLLRHPAVRSVALVDVDSGMVLDAAGPGPGPDPELLGARHAELARAAIALSTQGPDGIEGDVVVAGGGAHHVLRLFADPHGGSLVLAAVVVGSRSTAGRIRRRLRRVPVAALTAGPAWAPRTGASGGPRTAAPPFPARPLTRPHTPR